MMYRVPFAARRALTAALVSALLLLASPALFGPKLFAADEELPSVVSAVYQISFGAFGHIGYFRFRSDIKGEAYSLTADAKIETTVLDYIGRMQSSGSVLSLATKPASYMFRFNQDPLIGQKTGATLRMAFDDAGVKNVRFVPPNEPSPKVIPVTEQQLKNVLDPLSAIMALSLGNQVDPCDRTLPIFDGKQRFDIVFKPTGKAAGPGGGMICRVNLVPISGHRPGEGSDKIVSGNIEVVLRPVPKANVVIPYRITVPTIIGSAVLTSERIDITMPDRKRIALRN